MKFAKIHARQKIFSIIYKLYFYYIRQQYVRKNIRNKYAYSSNNLNIIYKKMFLTKKLFDNNMLYTKYC